MSLSPDFKRDKAPSSVAAGVGVGSGAGSDGSSGVEVGFERGVGESQRLRPVDRKAIEPVPRIAFPIGPSDKLLYSRIIPLIHVYDEDLLHRILLNIPLLLPY